MYFPQKESGWQFFKILLSVDIEYFHSKQNYQKQTPWVRTDVRDTSSIIMSAVCNAAEVESFFTLDLSVVVMFLSCSHEK